MTFLIDGYNLMHAIGLAARAMPGKRFGRGRTWLLDWLADGFEGKHARARIVFDARMKSGPDRIAVHHGIDISFAHGETADELIEQLVNASPHPTQLTVVSNDMQVRESGRRRGCALKRCEEFVDWVIALPDEPVSHPAEPEKPITPATSDEMSAWLVAFSTPKAKARPRK